MKQFTFNPNQPKDHVSALFSALSKRPAIADIDGFLFEIQNGGTTVTSCDLDNRVELTEKNPAAEYIPDPFAFVMPTEAAKMIFASKTPVQISVDMETFKIQFNGMTFTGWSAEDYPIRPEVPVLNFGVIQAEKVAELFKFATKDDMRPAMKGVIISKTLCASDGHRLITRTGPAAFQTFTPERASEPDGIPQFIAAPAPFWSKIKGTFRIFPPAGKERPYYMLTHYNGFLNIYARSTQDVTYPDFTAVIPEPGSEKYTFTIYRDLFIRELDQVAQAANRTTKQVTLYLLAGDDRMKLEAKDLDYKKEALIPVSGNHTAPYLQAIHFAADLFKSVIQAGPDVQTWRVVTTRMPIVSDDPDGIRLIMPVISYNEEETEPVIEIDVRTDNAGAEVMKGGPDSGRYIQDRRNIEIYLKTREEDKISEEYNTAGTGENTIHHWRVVAYNPKYKGPR